MDRLTSLTVFLRVADLGGFSAAARHLRMSTTMVSNHVQALEERLGARLLNRTTRRVSLTEVGKTYYESCTQIVAELDAADQVAGAMQSTLRGTLRLYVGTNLIRFVAPEVTEFLALHPEVTIDLSVGDRKIDLIEEGIDLTLRSTPTDDTSVIVHKLTGWRHILCCAPSYLERHPVPERLEDLTRHNCLRYTYYPFGDEWRFTVPGRGPASVRVHGNLVTNSGETLRLVALDGQGILLGANFMIADDLREGRLVRILPDYVPLEFSINAVYPHRRHLPAKVRAFIDLMAERSIRYRRWMDVHD